MRLPYFSLELTPEVDIIIKKLFLKCHTEEDNRKSQDLHLHLLILMLSLHTRNSPWYSQKSHLSESDFNQLSSIWLSQYLFLTHCFLRVAHQFVPFIDFFLTAQTLQRTGILIRNYLFIVHYYSGLALAGCQVPTHPLCHFCSSAGQGNNIRLKADG